MHTRSYVWMSKIIYMLLKNFVSLSLKFSLKHGMQTKKVKFFKIEDEVIVTILCGLAAMFDSSSEANVESYWNDKHGEEMKKYKIYNLEKFDLIGCFFSKLHHEELLSSSVVNKTGNTIKIPRQLHFLNKQNLETCKTNQNYKNNDIIKLKDDAFDTSTDEEQVFNGKLKEYTLKIPQNHPFVVINVGESGFKVKNLKSSLKKIGSANVLFRIEEEDCKRLGKIKNLVNSLIRRDRCIQKFYSNTLMLHKEKNRDFHADTENKTSSMTQEFEYPLPAGNYQLEAGQEDKFDGESLIQNYDFTIFELTSVGKPSKHFILRDFKPTDFFQASSDLQPESNLLFVNGEEDLCTVINKLLIENNNRAEDPIYGNIKQTLNNLRETYSEYKNKVRETVQGIYDGATELQSEFLKYVDSDIEFGTLKYHFDKELLPCLFDYDAFKWKIIECTSTQKDLGYTMEVSDLKHVDITDKTYKYSEYTIFCIKRKVSEDTPAMYHNVKNFCPTLYNIHQVVTGEMIKDFISLGSPCTEFDFFSKWCMSIAEKIIPARDRRSRIMDKQVASVLLNTQSMLMAYNLIKKYNKQEEKTYSSKNCMIYKIVSTLERNILIKLIRHFA